MTEAQRLELELSKERRLRRHYERRLVLAEGFLKFYAAEKHWTISKTDKKPGAVFRANLKEDFSTSEIETVADNIVNVAGARARAYFKLYYDKDKLP